MKTDKNKKNILLIEDDRNAREGIAKLLRPKYNITVAEDGIRGINILNKNNFDLVLSDIQMPGADGMTVLKESLKKSPPPLCVLITAYGSIETAVEAIKAGAYDFISKPIDFNRFELVLEHALESKLLKEENTQLKKQLDEKYNLENIIGNSSKIHEVFDIVKQVAPAKTTILITGESGTGKELVARAIHALSGRNGAFIPIHCAALPDNLLESELFGYEKGAFTGATERRKGRFELADAGTVFLDEISEINLSIQVKLLRILETKTFERLGGGNEQITSDARIITATNKNLQELVREGKFREDLFYRLNVLNIELPSLRERKDDIPLLVKNFIGYFASENNKDVMGISEEALNILLDYNWPGNVRELKNCIEKMVVLTREKELQIVNIPGNIKEKISPIKNNLKIDSFNLYDNEKMFILKALDETNWNKTLAAKKLGISRRTLHRKLIEYDINEKYNEETKPG